jgi:hypothetical protein
MVMITTPQNFSIASRLVTDLFWGSDESNDAGKQVGGGDEIQAINRFDVKLQYIDWSSAQAGSKLIEVSSTIFSLLI